MTCAVANCWYSGATDEIACAHDLSNDNFMSIKINHLYVKQIERMLQRGTKEVSRSFKTRRSRTMSVINKRAVHDVRGA